MASLARKNFRFSFWPPACQNYSVRDSKPQTGFLKERVSSAYAPQSRKCVPVRIPPKKVAKTLVTSATANATTSSYPCPSVTTW
jgi:hypothetical protein